MQKTANRSQFSGHCSFYGYLLHPPGKEPPASGTPAKKTPVFRVGSLMRKIMQITTCILLMASLGVAARGSSQKVTFTGKEVPLKTVFAVVQQQTGYSFVYNKDILAYGKPVSLSVSNMPVEQFLELAFKGTPIAVRFDNGTIVLSRKHPDPSVELRVPEGVLADTIPKMTITGIIFLNDPYSSAQPLGGATVLQKGTKVGTTTNEKGEFTLRVTPGSVLRITHVNAEPYEIELVNGQTNYKLEVRLKDAAEAKDLVVTGYYTRRKESFTGASTTITRKELEKFNNNNILSVIQSLDPSFQIEEDLNAGSNPNQIPNINIRGIGSVGSNVNLPLIIIDGFQGTLQQLYDMDVNRIESISILKDASATILYGSRGGNGVLVIETRLPKAGKFTVSYDMRPSLTLVDLSDYNLMNASEKLRFDELAGVYQYSGTTTTDPYWIADYQMKLDNVHRDRILAVQKGVNTYWLSQPVQSPLSIGHSIRAEGGNQEVRYSIDGSYNDFKGAMKGSGRKRYGAAFNLIYRIPNKLTIRNNATFQSTHEYNSPFGEFSLYTKLNPYDPIYDDAGNFVYSYNDAGPNAPGLLGGQRLYNPIYNSTLPYKNFDNTTQLTDNLSFEWFINRQFKLNAVGVISKTYRNSEKYISPLHTMFFTQDDPSLTGLYAISNGDGVQYQANLSLQYGNTFGNHTVTANAISELRSSNAYLTSYNLTGFVDDRFISPGMALQFKPGSRPDYSAVPERLVGFAGNLHYDFGQRYLVDFSYRIDGSSKFGSANRFGSFWSLGGGYNLHRETFFNSDFFTTLRLFANVGVTGNENFTADMTSTAYVFKSDDFYYLLNGASYNSQGNPALTWPKVKQKSAGIDAAFWDSRINVRLNYYSRVTNRMISAITVAPSMGFADNRLYENLGEVTNKGFELNTSVMVYANPKNNLYWNINFAAVQNRSLLTKISDELRKLNETLVIKDADGAVTRSSSYYEENQSLRVFRGVRSLGIDPATGRELLQKLNGDRTFLWSPEDQVVIGDAEEKLRGTFGTDVSYKGLSMRLIFMYDLGGDIYNETLVSKVENASPYLNADRRVLESRWQEPGDVAFYKSIADQSVTQLTSRFVQKENTVRLSSLNINYDFDKVKISKYRLQRLRLNFSTNDLFRISSVRMERGINYPFARTYNLGVMVEY